ncbi:MAG: hypothetical protein AAGF99_00660 [Bacteroidota bacterium]
MGQQQLLLLVLGIVIVGLAVSTGIEAFEENRKKSMIDRDTQEAVQMAAEIIAWYQKPTAMGGNGGQSDLSALTMETLGYPQNRSTSSRTEHRTDTQIRAIYRSSSAPIIHIHPMPWDVDDATLVEIAVYGPDPACMTRRTAIYQESRSGRVFDSGVHENPDPTRCFW